MKHVGFVAATLFMKELQLNGWQVSLRHSKTPVGAPQLSPQYTRKCVLLLASGAGRSAQAPAE